MLTPWEYSESTQVLYWNHNKDYIEKENRTCRKDISLFPVNANVCLTKGFSKLIEVHKQAIMS